MIVHVAVGTRGYYKLLAMTVDPSKIQLANLYTDAKQTLTNTDVYANGQMQALVYVSINYNDSVEGIEEDLSTYVYQNTEFVDAGGDPVKWEKSQKTNEYLHDINRGTLDAVALKTASDFRIPVYFTVPETAGGQYSWYAKLGDQMTNVPVTVTVTTIAVNPSDMEIVDIGPQVEQSHLRAMRYVHGQIPGNHLLKKWKYQGFKCNKTGGNTWLVMMSDKNACGALLEPYDGKNVHVAKSNTCYVEDEFQEVDVEYAHGIIDDTKNDSPNGIYIVPYITAYEYNGWENPDIIPLDSVKEAWEDGGLGMVCIAAPSEDNSFRLFHMWYDFLNYHFDPIVEDNFGNHLKIVINWDTGGEGDHKNWGVISVQNYYEEF